MIEVDLRVAVVLRALQEKAATQGVSLVILLQPLAEPNGTSVFFERTPEERAAVFEAWANSHRITAPPLSDEAISRDSIYKDDFRYFAGITVVSPPEV